MKTLYETSNVFPWDPPEKRKQMFHEYSRFLLVTPHSDANTVLPEGNDLLAYSIFRFERDEGRNVIYIYELQASQAARRLGLGRALIHNLNTIGRAFNMSLLMLTHLKANNAAKAFYDSVLFEIDETSPDYDDGSRDKESEKSSELDEGYSILSHRIAN